MDYRKNAEKYPDPTAYGVIRSENQEEKRLSTLIYVLKYIISLAGYDLIARIQLRDKKTGKEYR